MPKRNKFRSFSETNRESKYQNRRASVFLQQGINSKIEAWECPDGTGNWFTYSVRIKGELRFVHKIKVTDGGIVLEEELTTGKEHQQLF